MSIVTHDDWSLSERGKRDAQRHKEKIDEQIRKNVRDVIGEESIITRKDGKTVKIPVKGLKDYQFKHGIDNGTQRGGVGQGKGKAGDVVARQKGNGNPADGNEAGNQRGEEYMEVEVDIDYLIQLMFQDLGLPYLEEKTKVEQLVPAGYKFETISKIGIQPRIHKKKTLMETIKRTAVYVGEIIDITGCSNDIAEIALVQSKGDLEEAIEIIQKGKIDLSIDPEQLYIEDDDLRYNQIEEAFEPRSSAVVIAMMDISGSMTPEKKYLCRSFLFWMVEFLRKAYDNVQIRFIVHTTEARLVEEDAFFRKGENGGTLCKTAFDLANHLLESEFPNDEYNRYVVYCSDGEDFDPDATMKSAQKMLDSDINMLSYLEVKPKEDVYSYGDLLKRFRKHFNMKATTTDGRTFFKNEEKHFLAGEIKDRSDIYPCLKSVLFKEK